jgi:hypothetical protein
LRTHRSSAKTIAEFITYAMANPPAWPRSAAARTSHLAGELFKMGPVSTSCAPPRFSQPSFLPPLSITLLPSQIEKSIIEFTKYTNFLYLLPHHAHNQQPAT